MTNKSRDTPIDRIVVATVVLDADNDHFLNGEPRRAAEAMTNTDTTLITLPEAEGAGEHCHMGAFARQHQTIFDWLDHTLPAALPRSSR
jgi:hypothetical protein